MEANSGLALRHRTPRVVYDSVHARSGGSHFFPETPNPGSDGGSPKDPLHRFTSARLELAVRRRLEAAGTQIGEPRCRQRCTSGTRRSRVSPSPPPGVLYKPRARTGPGPLTTGIQKATNTAHGGVRASSGHAYLALDQLHHFGCRGEEPHEFL